MKAEDIDAILARHERREWTECDESGMPHEPGTGHDLPPYCAGCSDEYDVAALEFGDTIDTESGGVVPWPCDAATALHALRDALAEVERLRDEAHVRDSLTLQIGAERARAQAINERDAERAKVRAVLALHSPGVTGNDGMWCLCGAYLYDDCPTRRAAIEGAEVDRG